jgi:hypothetical protein
MADKIVSWGGFDSKGTSGMGVTGSFQVSSSANSFFVGGGNVGIGTTSPSVSLDVAGNASFGASQLFKITDQGSGNFDLGGSTVNTYINGTTFRVRSGSNIPLYVDGSNNRVGIGTTSITAKLQVLGSGTTSSTTSFLVQNANASASLSVLDNNRVVIGTETVSQGSLYIGHNGTSGGSNGTSTLFFASQFGSNYPYRLGAEGNGYDFYLRQANGGQGSVNIDFSGLNNISYTITNTNVLNQSFATSSIIVTKSTLNSYLAIGNKGGFSNSQTDGDTPLIFFRSMTGGYYDKTVDAAVTIRNGSPTAADDNINKNTAFWYRNGYIGIGTSTSLFATNTLQGALTINQGTNTGYANRFPTTASLVNTSGLSTTVTFTPDNGNTAPSYNIIVGTIITANSASRKVTAVRFQNVTVDTAVDWSGGYPYTYRNPYVSIADGSTPIFDINPSGNVGIGTSTPTASLHISGSSGSVLLEIDSPTQNNILHVSGSGRVGIGKATDYALEIANTSSLLVSATGWTPTAVSTASAAVSITPHIFVTAGNRSYYSLYVANPGITISGSFGNYDQRSIYAAGKIDAPGGINAGDSRFYNTSHAVSFQGYNPYDGLTGGSAGGITFTSRQVDSGNEAGIGAYYGGGSRLYIYNKYNASDSKIIFALAGTTIRAAFFGTGNLSIGNGETDMSARLGVKGSGTTSSTTSLLVQNANASASLQVRDDQSIIINGSSSMTIANSGSALTLTRTGNYSNIGTKPILNIIDDTNHSNVSKTAVYISATGASDNRAMEIYGGVGIGTFAYATMLRVSYPTYLNNTADVFASSNFGLSSKSSISSYATNNGGGISFWGDDRGQASAPVAFAGIRGVKENSTYLNSLGNLVFYVQTGSAGGSTENTFKEAARFNSLGYFGIGTSNPSSSLTNTNPSNPLPSGVPTGSFAVSSSVPPKPYFYDGTVWNALY